MLNSKLTALIHDLHDQTSKGCGLNYELFSERFSNALDHHVDALEEPDRALFIELAIELGYTPPNERIDPRDLGLCTHHFDPSCCPLGCGDL